jgi:hypothetical protein
MKLPQFLFNLIIYSVFIFSSSIHAAEKKTQQKAETPKCVSRTWDGPRNMSVENYRHQFKTIAMDELIQMAWGEMLANKKDSMALPLLYFLSANAQADLLAGYYKAMAIMITGLDRPDEKFKEWPKRPKSYKPPYNLKKLCSLHKETIKKSAAIK